MILRAIQSWPSFVLSALFLIGGGVGWVFPASRLALVPGAVQIADGVVILERSFPGDRFGLPRPVMTYREVIRPLTPLHNGGHYCTQTGGPIRYVNAAPVGTWSIGWAADCINDPTGYHWEASWRWHIGGIPLGPVSVSTVVFSTQRDTE